ncbi:MAG: transposase [Desulfohalobiaceae bacterium]
MSQAPANDGHLERMPRIYGTFPCKSQAGHKSVGASGARPSFQNGAELTHIIHKSRFELSMTRPSQTRSGRRKSIRLSEYDYSQPGAYFVTICAYNRYCIFGHIADERMILNQLGLIVQEEWERTAEIRKEIQLDAYVIMPNHLHGIVIIHPKDTPGGASGARPSSPETSESARSKPKSLAKKSLGAMIAGVKSAVTKRQKLLNKCLYHPVWQRNYYEHIIRNESDLNMIREYISSNPSCWEKDRLHPVFGKEL